MNLSTKNHPVSRQPRFQLGVTLSTPAALDHLNANGVSPVELLVRHQSGGWGEVCPDDAQANEQAVVRGGRILSVYTVAKERVYVLTEADRSSTTLLFPREY